MRRRFDETPARLASFFGLRRKGASRPAHRAATEPADDPAGYLKGFAGATPEQQQANRNSPIAGSMGYPLYSQNNFSFPCRCGLTLWINRQRATRTSFPLLFTPGEAQNVEELKSFPHVDNSIFVVIRLNSQVFKFSLPVHTLKEKANEKKKMNLCRESVRPAFGYTAHLRSHITLLSLDANTENVENQECRHPGRQKALQAPFQARMQRRVGFPGRRWTTSGSFFSSRLGSPP